MAELCDVILRTLIYKQLDNKLFKKQYMYIDDTSSYLIKIQKCVKYFCMTFELRLLRVELSIA